MKKLSYLFLAVTGLVVALASRSEDSPEPMNPGAPTIAVTPATGNAAPGGTMDFTVTAAPGAGTSVVSVTADERGEFNFETYKIGRSFSLSLSYHLQAI